jgi:hypothetical protein
LRELRKAKTTSGMAELISRSLPTKADYNRVHVSGDFFSQVYFDAWLRVAQANPARIFYGYTKSIPYVVKRRGQIPSNLRLVASLGGRYDSQIRASGLYTARVVFSEEEAAVRGLPIDHDDSHAIEPHCNFALLLHGTQPAKTDAAAALKILRKAGKGGYSK